MTKGIAAGFFSHGDLFAYQCAIRYAGEHGRVLTMPDLCTLRARADIGDPLWDQHYTSSSSEFYGVSNGGVPVVAVMHGGGPLADFDFLARTMENGCRIDAALFLEILDGQHGSVEVVDFNLVTSEKQYPFAPLTAEQALANPLWVARMGGLDVASAYITRHAMVSLAVREKEGDRHGGHAGYIIKMQEAEECYTVIDERGKGELWYAPRLPDDGFAFAHLLAMGGAFRSSLGGTPGLYYVSDIGPLGRGDGVNFCAMSSGEPKGIVAVPSPIGLYEALGDVILVPQPSQDEDKGIFLIRNDDRRIFATRANDDEDHPEHPVSELVKVGSVTFRQKPLGYYGLFKYKVSDVEPLVPSGANAFKFSNLRLESPEMQVADLTFYRAAFDRSKRLPKMAEVMSSPQLVAAAIDALV